MHHPTDRIAHTTAFVTPVVEHWLGQLMIKNTNPIINLVFPALASSTVVGTRWGSPGPNIPWGRMAIVKKSPELDFSTS